MTDFEKNEYINQVATVMSSAESISLSNAGTTPAERATFLSTFTVKEDRAIKAKVDQRLLWLISLMCLLKNLNFQNAALVRIIQVGSPNNIQVQLKMTNEEYNWVQSIYFISYIIFEIPSNLILKKMTPRHWQSRIMLTWGIVLTCHAAVKNKEGYWTLRFLLGMFEAGLSPGISTHIISWYRTEEMGKPNVCIFGMNAFAPVLGPLIVYGCSYIDGRAGLSGWQWVYLLEGIFTIFFSAVVFFALPDYPKSPRSSKWLTVREQEYLKVRLTENVPRINDKRFDVQEIWVTLKNPRTYAFTIAQLFINLGGYALTWQLPLIIANLGFATLNRSILLILPIAGTCLLGVTFAGWFMKKAYISRPLFNMYICAAMLSFYNMLAVVTGRIAIYMSLLFGMTFYLMYFVPFWSWRKSTLIGTTGTAFTLALQNSLGQVGGVVGPQLFLDRFAPMYKVPFGICAASIGFGWLATIWMWYTTRNIEWDVNRIRRLKIDAKKHNGTYTGDDIKVMNKRHFYHGLNVERDNLEAV